MQNRPQSNNGTLNRSETKTMLKLHHRPGNLFFTLPADVIKRIKYSPTPDPEFLSALSDAARGNFDALKAKLEAAKDNEVELKKLLLQAGDVVTRSGLPVQGTTILKAAFGERDTRMVAMIKPYFDRFKGGDQERESQLERCREAMARPRNEKPYEALKKLINAIKTSPLKDIQSALGKRYEDCNEELRNAFTEFRKETTLKALTNPGMHDDPAVLIEAFTLLFETEWKNLMTKNENGQSSYDKQDLIWRQVIGWLMRNLAGVHRFAFAQDYLKEDTDEKPLPRITNDKGVPVCTYDEAELFLDTSPSDSSLSGLGSDYGILGAWRLCGQGRRGEIALRASWPVLTFISNNNAKLAELMMQPAQTKCVIL